MTKISNLYSLTNYITANSSGNVVIATPTSGFALDVTGTGRFTGQLTLGSTITNGTFTYTLPAATGTLALTSAIPTNPVGGTGTTNYLPKFTGASTIGNSSIFDNGNVAIGSISPVSIGSYKTLLIQGGSTSQGGLIQLQNSDSTCRAYWFNTNDNSTLKTVTNHQLIFGANNTDYLYLNTSGNLGLGVTPSAWGTQNTVLQLLNNTSLISRSGFTALARNLFYTTSDVAAYISDGVATNYLQISGEHRWLNAVSGTAGATMTQIQAMTLTASGRLLIAKTNDEGFTLDVNGTGRFSGALTGTSSSFSSTITSTNERGFRSSDAVNGGSSWLFGANTGRYFISVNGGVNALIIENTGAATFSSTSSGGQNIRMQTSLAAGRNYLQWANPSGDMGYIGYGGADSKFYIINQLNDDMLFYTNSQPRMTILAGGNVGIGTTAPGAKLDILGTGIITSKIKTSSIDGVALFNAFNDANETNEFGTWGSSRGGFGAISPNNGYIFASNGLAIGTTTEIKFGTGASNTERMRITSTGRVGIGTTSPSGRLSVSSDQGIINQLINIIGTQSGFAQEWGFGFPSSSRDLRVYDYTNGLERARFTSGGYFKASNSGSYYNSTGASHELNQNQANWIAETRNSGSTPYGFIIRYTAASPNVTGDNQFIWCEDSTNSKFIVWSNGSVVNRTGSYGTISDVKFKENIVDATPKLADLMNLKVRNFNLKGESTKQIGFIAQEFEEVFPNMVDVSTERGTDGETYKSIKTSVLVPMLVKAIQELSAKVTALENK
jgi:hypothetical protein